MTSGHQPPQGERDLDALLRSMRPELRAGEWVFVSVPAVPEGVSPLALFVEDEGVSQPLQGRRCNECGQLGVAAARRRMKGITRGYLL
ncbi:MAG: ACT domain-containing protein [Pseudonocardiaceae bacterium]